MLFESVTSPSQPSQEQVTTAILEEKWSPEQVAGRLRLEHPEDMYERLRKALYMPVISAKRHNPIIMAFYERLLTNGKRPMQVIIAAMRKLLQIAYGALKSGQPFSTERTLA